jgi:hypothetical protein
MLLMLMLLVVVVLTICVGQLVMMVHRPFALDRRRVAVEVDVGLLPSSITTAATVERRRGAVAAPGPAKHAERGQIAAQRQGRHRSRQHLAGPFSCQQKSRAPHTTVAILKKI